MALDTAHEAMEKAIAHMEAELTKIRAGKAHPAMLDSVMVEYYGSMTPLSQVSNVNTSDARTLTVQAWEKWQSSDERKAALANITPILEGDEKYRTDIYAE